LLGLFYWWTVFPFHYFVFRRLLAGIQQDAIRIAGTSS
jgi:hypothetical protein